MTVLYVPDNVSSRLVPKVHFANAGVIITSQNPSFLASSPERQKARALVISDTHPDTPYADLYKGEKTQDRGIEGYYVINAAKEREFIHHPAQYMIKAGDVREVINLKEKNGPLTIGMFTRAIDRQMERDRARLRRHPACTQVEVEGNHSRWPEADVEMKEFAANERGQFEFHPVFYKIADALVIHGDRAMNPKKYDVDPPIPGNYDIANRRYEASVEEVYRSSIIQFFHDIGNRILPPILGVTLHRPERCARKIFEWCDDYDEKHPNEPSILEGVKHILFGHDHSELLASPQPHPRIMDPETGKPKIFLLTNTGANVEPLMQQLLPGGSSKSEHTFFNPVSIFLNTDNAKDPSAKITDIIPFVCPKRRWTSDIEHTSEPNRGRQKRHGLVYPEALEVA